MKSTRIVNGREESLTIVIERVTSGGSIATDEECFCFLARQIVAVFFAQSLGHGTNQELSSSIVTVVDQTPIGTSLSSQMIEPIVGIACNSPLLIGHGDGVAIRIVIVLLRCSISILNEERVTSRIGICCRCDSIAPTAKSCFNALLIS